MTDGKDHSPWGASGMYRWAACPGSINAIKALPADQKNKSSAAADEGTLAHDLAARALTYGNRAEVEAARMEKAGFEIPTDMAEAVQVYLDDVRDTMEACQRRGKLSVERPFDLSHIRPGLRGTNDACYWSIADRTLYVWDYKHGAGVPVEVVGNLQLRYYGVGAALADEGKVPDRVVITIVQPRCRHRDGPVRREVITGIELVEWALSVLGPAYDATLADKAPLHAGDHCRFCPAAPTCPAMKERALTEVQASFDPITDEVVVPDITDLSPTPDQLGRLLNGVDLLKQWIKALEDYAYEQAHAGRPPTGYKLAEKRANRKWIDEEEAAKALRSRLSNDDLFETKLRSPAQIEKRVSAGERAALIGPLVHAPSSGTKLVPDHDKAPAIQAGPAFNAITD